MVNAFEEDYCSSFCSPAAICLSSNIYSKRVFGPALRQVVVSRLREEASPAFNALMQRVSYLGETPAATSLMILAVAFFALRRQWTA
jgi:hypothetical protein